MSKKILILGAGNAQIDAILLCKEKGYEVYGCSYTTGDKGIPYLDHFIQLDIKDVASITEYVKKENIHVVYSVGSDLAVPTAMAVSEALNLPHFISSETAMICQAKHKMRTTLGNDFKGNIPFSVCSTLEEAMGFSDFPGMMKPVDSQGQRGCFRVDSAEDIKEHFAASLDYSKEGKVIIESFVDGPEISVNAYVQDGQLRFALVSDRIVFDEFPGGIIKEHLVPSYAANETARDETIDLVKRVLKKLHIDNGPAYFQIKLQDNHPIILEVTPRLDGCHMWNLIKHYCGADLLEATFEHLLEGTQVLQESYDFPDTPYKLAFMCEKPGQAYNRSNYCVDQAEYVCWYYEDGDIVRKLNGFMEKGGYRIFKC